MSAAAPAVPRESSAPAAAHRRPPLALIALIVVAIAGGGAYWRFGLPLPEAGGYRASGTVEAQEIVLASESAGRIAVVSVVAGERVRAGQEVARLDDTLLQIQYRQASSEAQALLREQIARTVLRSPIEGVVLRTPAHAGEVATPGAPIVVVGDVDNLELTVYVPAKELGRIEIGQQVDVSLAGGGQAVVGAVSRVATSAEFTPRNTQSTRDRLSLMFAVTVRIPSGGSLKPGMPVDAIFRG